MVSGDSETWLRAFLIQRFLVQHHSNLGHSRPANALTYAEVEEFWAQGVIEQVEALDGAQLMFAEGWDLGSARAAFRVRRSLGRLK